MPWNYVLIPTLKYSPAPYHDLEEDTQSLSPVIGSWVKRRVLGKMNSKLLNFDICVSMNTTYSTSHEYCKLCKF